MCQEFNIAEMCHVIVEQLLFYLNWKSISECSGVATGRGGV